MESLTAGNTAGFSRFEAHKSKLKTSLIELHDQLSAIERAPVRLGVLGTRGSCKTSLFAVWHLFGREDGIRQHEATLVAPWYRGKLRPKFDLAPDEQTMRRLQSICNDIIKHGTATATASARPDILSFALRVSDESGVFHTDLQTMDFSGQFLSPLDTHDPLKGLAEQARDFIRKCDVVLCLATCRDDALETSNGLDNCFQQLESRPGFILCITKFDERTGVPSGFEEEQATIKAMERENSSLAGIRKRIEDHFVGSGILSTMLIAPLGRDFAADKKNLPIKRDDLRPFNVCGPVLEAVRFRRLRIASIRQQIVEVRNALKELLGEWIDEVGRCTPRPENIAVLTSVLRNIASEANRIDETRLGDHAHRTMEAIQADFAGRKRMQLKEDFVRLESEISEGGIFRVGAWHDALSELGIKAREVGDYDLARDINRALRDLETKKQVVQYGKVIGLKVGEGVHVISLVVIALALSGLLFFVIAWFSK